MRGQPVGVEQVRCPVCRAAVGRPCTNRRGYLTEAHQARVTAWVALESAETLAARETASSVA